MHNEKTLAARVSQLERENLLLSERLERLSVELRTMQIDRLRSLLLHSVNIKAIQEEISNLRENEINQPDYDGNVLAHLWVSNIANLLMARIQNNQKMLSDESLIDINGLSQYLLNKGADFTYCNNQGQSALNILANLADHRPFTFILDWNSFTIDNLTKVFHGIDRDTPSSRGIIKKLAANPEWQDYALVTDTRSFWFIDPSLNKEDGNAKIRILSIKLFHMLAILTENKRSIREVLMQIKQHSNCFNRLMAALITQISHKEHVSFAYDVYLYLSEEHILCANIVDNTIDRYTNGEYNYDNLIEHIVSLLNKAHGNRNVAFIALVITAFNCKDSYGKWYGTPSDIQDTISQSVINLLKLGCDIEIIKKVLRSYNKTETPVSPEVKLFSDQVALFVPNLSQLRQWVSHRSTTVVDKFDDISEKTTMLFSSFESALLIKIGRIEKSLTNTRAMSPFSSGSISGSLSRPLLLPDDNKPDEDDSAKKPSYKV